MYKSNAGNDGTNTLTKWDVQNTSYKSRDATMWPTIAALMVSQLSCKTACYHELAERHDDLSVVSCPFQRSIGPNRWQVDMDAKRGYMSNLTSCLPEHGF
jgi:hypothetical protein